MVAIWLIQGRITLTGWRRPITTMSRPQSTISAFVVATLVVTAFLGGIHFERERQRREDLSADERADHMRVERRQGWFDAHLKPLPI